MIPGYKVIVDPNNFIAETKENDNRATAALKMADQSLANLAVKSSNVAITPKTPRAGQRIVVTAVIVNHGSAPARDVDVQFMDAHGDARCADRRGAVDFVDPRWGQRGCRHGLRHDRTKRVTRRLEVVVDPGNFNR